MKSRRAISLIELMVIMSASTVALTLTAVLLHRAMRVQMHCRAHVDAERTALRLANQFRRDVHAARTDAASIAEQAKDAFLRLEFTGGRTAEYSRIAGTVVRLESGGGKPVWREEFAFPALTELTIEQGNEPQRLILTITAKPAASPPTADQPLASTYTIPVSIHAEAVVGRNLRFGAAPTGQEAPE